MSIVYLSNSFPEPLEPYVSEEISELSRGREWVLPCSIRRPHCPVNVELRRNTLYVFPVRFKLCVQASWVLARKFSGIGEFLLRALSGREPIAKRIRNLVHTWLGAYLYLLLRNRGVRHIHVHHGYFASWVGMVAAKLLGASISMTLHGSDLLVRADYLDIKLKHCKFCVTISEFNRSYILKNHPQVDSRKILVHRLGIDTRAWRPSNLSSSHCEAVILSVGRLHAVKNHEFLILACRGLKSSGVKFRCLIAGEGGEHAKLACLIKALELEQEIELRGHIPRERLPELYAQADVVVLTSRSEGIPVALMESMSAGRLVLAPEITGIPELIQDGKNGFLYQPNSMEDFLHKLEFLLHTGRSLNAIRRAARLHVQREFDRSRNLNTFASSFLDHVNGQVNGKNSVSSPAENHENPLLQQVQLSL